MSRRDCTDSSSSDGDSSPDDNLAASQPADVCHAPGDPNQTDLATLEVSTALGGFRGLVVTDSAEVSHASARADDSLQPEIAGKFHAVRPVEM